MKVLVVDDEVAIRSAVESLFLDEGHEVGVAANGAAALELVESFRPHVILLDLRMPVMDGETFIARFRRLPGPHAPIIVCSTHAGLNGPTALGSAAFLQKPFDIGLLIDLVERHGSRFQRLYADGSATTGEFIGDSSSVTFG